MDDTVIATHLENLDHRLEGVQQILQHNVDPRLAGMESRLSNVEQILQQDIEPRLAHVEQILPTLVTREYLDERLTAQSGELRQEFREGLEQSRRHMDVIAESLRSDIQLIAEHLASIMPKGTGS
jgi:hypothetical protein